MSINLDLLSDNMEYNILLIGREGQGKSTFVNAFANYLKFSSLDEAMDGEFEKLIPARFLLRIPHGDNGYDSLVLISAGNDANEEPTLFMCSSTQSPRVYNFRHNNKHIRLIDTPGWRRGGSVINKIDHKCHSAIVQCLRTFSKLHAIVLVTNRALDIHASGDTVDYEFLLFIHQIARQNVVICRTDNSNFRFQNLTKITPKRGQNLLTIDNCAYQCLIADKRYFDYIQMNRYRESWQLATGEIQTMLNYIADQEAFDSANTLLLLQSYQVIYFYIDLMRYDFDKSILMNNLSDLLYKEQNERDTIEDIIVQMCGMLCYASMIEWKGFKLIAQKCQDTFFKGGSTNFYTKLLNLFSTRQCFVEQFSQCSLHDDFHRLFDELKSLKHSGAYFTEQIDKITTSSVVYERMSESTIIIDHKAKIRINLKKYQTKVDHLVQLQQILSIVTENKMLLIDMKSADTTKCDFTNATLENVVFTCGQNSTNLMRDFIVKQTNTTEADIQFIFENMDQLIKSNFERLIPVLKHYSPVQSIIQNEGHINSSTLEIASITQNIFNQNISSHQSVVVLNQSSDDATRKASPKRRSWFCC